MCDYSLHHIGSRSAKVSDRLVSTELARSSTRGFAAVGELGAKLVIDEAPPKVAVCLLPGTELAFDEPIRYDRAPRILGTARTEHKLARFRQIETRDPHVHYDALEFPDGQVLRITRLVAGQTAKVLQLPAVGQHHDHHEAEAARAAARRGASRLAVNRVALRPGLGSVLMPSQNAVMVWQTLRSAAVTISEALEQSIRRWTPHRPAAIAGVALPAGSDAVPGDGAGRGGIAAAMPPTAQRPESTAAA